MKKIGTIFIIFLALLVVRAHAIDKKEWKILSNSLGPIKLGMSMSDLDKVSPKNIIYETINGENEIVKLAHEKTKEIYRIFLNKKKEIVLIVIYDPVFKTEKGIKIGDTFEKIKKAYPASKIEYGSDEGGYLVLKNKTLEFHFLVVMSDLDDSKGKLDINKIKKLKSYLIVVDGNKP